MNRYYQRMLKAKILSEDVDGEKLEVDEEEETTSVSPS